jgi:transcriptional regulatory protein RtcR
MLLRALEEKRFLPLGSDREVTSDFQLIAGTNRDLAGRVREGQFREDLLARMNLRTFRLPGLAERPEDIEPNLDYELEQFAQRRGARATISKETREAFLAFTRSPAARCSANFRDLNACHPHGHAGPRRSDHRTVLESEMDHLRKRWAPPAGDFGHEAILEGVLGNDAIEKLDLFDRAQLAFVIHLCRESASLSEAGRKLFAATREKRKTANDADRLRKYLARFELDWFTVSKAP